MGSCQRCSLLQKRDCHSDRTDTVLQPSSAPRSRRARFFPFYKLALMIVCSQSLFEAAGSIVLELMQTLSEHPVEKKREPTFRAQAMAMARPNSTSTGAEALFVFPFLPIQSDFRLMLQYRSNVSYCSASDVYRTAKLLRSGRQWFQQSKQWLLSGRTASRLLYQPILHFPRPTLLIATIFKNKAIPKAARRDRNDAPARHPFNRTKTCST